MGYRWGGRNSELNRRPHRHPDSTQNPIGKIPERDPGRCARFPPHLGLLAALSCQLLSLYIQRTSCHIGDTVPRGTLSCFVYTLVTLSDDISAARYVINVRMWG